MKQCRILCFGDSLTRGCGADQPYSSHLKTLLQPDLAQLGINLVIDTVGIDGICVNPEMGWRLPVVLGLEKKDEKEKEEEEFILDIHVKEQDKPRYHIVVILGGTNDINGEAENAKEIFSGLVELYAACFQAGATVIALTVPDLAYATPEMLREGNLLNEMIRTYKPEEKSHLFQVAEISTSLPYHTAKERDRNVYYHQDGCHLTTSGYQRIAKLVSPSIHLLMKKLVF